MADDSTTLSASFTPEMKAQNTFGDDSPALSGLSTGMQLANLQQQTQDARQRLEIAKQQHQMMAADKFMSAIAQMGKVKGPAQKAMFKVAEQVYPMVIPGGKLDPGTFDFLKDSNNGSVAALQQYYDLLKAAKPIPDDVHQAVLSFFGGDPTAYSKFVEGVNNAVIKAQNAQTIAAGNVGAKVYQANVTARSHQDQIAAQQAMKDRELKAKAISQGIEPSAVGSDADSFVAANAAGRIAAQKQAMNDSKANLQNAQAGAASDNADTNSGKLDETTRHNKATEQIQRDRNAILKNKQNTTNGNQDANRQIRATNAITRDPIIVDTEKGYNASARAAQLLQTPNPKWADLTEVAAAMNQILSGSSRSAQTREQKMDFTSLGRTYDTIMGKINNHEEGGPSPEELQTWRQRIARIQDATKQAHSSQLAKLYSNYSKFLPSDFLERNTLGAKFNAQGQLDRSAGMQAPAPQPSPQPSAPKVDIGALQTQAQAAIKAGKDPAAVRALYKQKTGQDLPQ